VEAARQYQQPLMITFAEAVPEDAVVVVDSAAGGCSAVAVVFAVVQRRPLISLDPVRAKTKLNLALDMNTKWPY
jgi:hypothetical protein